MMIFDMSWYNEYLDDIYKIKQIRCKYLDAYMACVCYDVYNTSFDEKTSERRENKS